MIKTKKVISVLRHVPNLGRPWSNLAICPQPRTTRPQPRTLHKNHTNNDRIFTKPILESRTTLNYHFQTVLEPIGSIFM